MLEMWNQTWPEHRARVMNNHSLLIPLDGESLSVMARPACYGKIDS